MLGVSSGRVADGVIVSMDCEFNVRDTAKLCPYRPTIEHKTQKHAHNFPDVEMDYSLAKIMTKRFAKQIWFSL